MELANESQDNEMVAGTQTIHDECIAQAMIIPIIAPVLALAAAVADVSLNDTLAAEFIATEGLAAAAVADDVQLNDTLAAEFVATEGLAAAAVADDVQLNDTIAAEFVATEGLDISKILPKGLNQLMYPGESRGLYCTINEGELQRGIKRYDVVLKPQLNLHKEQLLKWSKDIRLARTDEGKEALSSLLKKTKETVMKQAHWGGITTDNALFKNNTLMYKSLKKFGDHFMSSLTPNNTTRGAGQYDDDRSQVLQDLMKYRNGLKIKV